MTKGRKVSIVRRMPVEISPATPSDVPDIVKLLLLQFREHDIPTSPEALVATVTGFFEDPTRGFILIAREDGRGVGIACLSATWTLEHGGKSLWLEELQVEPDKRSQGIGQALVRAAIEEARRFGAAAIDLEVEESHARAEHLYAREGWIRHTRNRWVNRLRKRPGE